MEQNTNIETALPTNTEHINVMPVNNPAKKKLNKKTIILISVAVVILVGLGIGYYFYMKKPVMPYIPTVEEKSKAAEETVNKTKELGLPPVKKQIDIMNYNLQN